MKSNFDLFRFEMVQVIHACKRDIIRAFVIAEAIQGVVIVALVKLLPGS